MKRPPRPDSIVGSLFWMLTYYTWKILALVSIIVLGAYLILCFTCSWSTPWGTIGSKPVETKINVNK